ncbi:MAG: T9SS type A sorting domain-containing protein [Ignavibacteriales bacterium]|nr:T9SS type A sorting domain-containing protein [Ignavibacteriales bacterium]
MKNLFHFLIVLTVLFLTSQFTYAQPWTYNFGTGTGTWTTGVSTTFLPSPPSGGGDTARVRIGTQGGSFNMENPGISDLGTGTELRGVAPTGGSVNKMSIVNYTPGKTFTMKFTVRFGGGASGIWYFFQGDGASYNDNNAFSGTQVFTGLSWTFAASGTITSQYRNGSAWTTLAGTPFAQDVNYSVEIYGNNSTSTINYSYGTPQTVASNTYDLWVNGILAGDDLTKGLIANDVNIDSWMFYGASSTTNVATIYLDDFEYSNSISGTASNGPPSISSITRTTFVPATSGTTDVQSSITDDHNISSAKLHVRVNGGNYDSTLTMSVVSGSTYGATIPASKHVTNGDLVEYFISAIDDSSAYTASGLGGYFVGDSRIDSIKSHGVTEVAGYGARVNGTINVGANIQASNACYIQDVSGGIRLSATGMPWSITAGRNAKVEGTIAARFNSYQLQTPNFNFVDTLLGNSTVTPVTITLPTSKDSSYINEGRLVKILSMTTDSAGKIFTATKIYPYKEADNDTISLYVESNGTANTIVGKTIPSSATDVIGILTYYNTYMEIKPRKAEDLGLSTGDGSGTAAIKATTRLVSLTAVAETLTVTGDGTNTLESVSIQIPLTWTWTNTTSYVLTGAFAGKTPVITGDGSTTPRLITISGLLLTDINPGTIEIKDLNTPASSGTTTFTVKTAITSGTLTTIASSPTVNITTNTFEAIATGNWNNGAIWSGGVVPTASDDVTMTTGNVVVTITADAQCNKLTMVGVADTVGGIAGPVLQFNTTGVLTLTVNGKLDLSGTPGRPKFTSNGNTAAIVVFKSGVFTNVSNSTSIGSPGLNMNEGTVKFLGTSTDTLKTDAGFRLGNLIIGDDSNPKTLYWNQTTSATMNIQSLTVKGHSSFIIGMESEANINGIGNYSTAGVPMLTGGILIEPNASMLVNNTSGASYSAYINLKNGGITNNGTLNLKSPNGSRKYSLAFGELTADPTGSKQTIGGTNVGTYSFVKVGDLDTILLSRSMNLDTLLINGEIVESSGNTIVGVSKTTRRIEQSVANNCGGIGVVLTGIDVDADTTIIYRTTGTAQTSGVKSSILRSFDFIPYTGTGLNAAFDFYYDDNELNGQTEGTLKVWKSTDAGIFWIDQPTTVNTALNKLSSFTVNSASRWTAADASNPLGGDIKTLVVTQGWNLISLPYIVPDARKIVLFPTVPGNAFYYEGNYKVEDTLKKGIGYWLKFPSDTTFNFTGVDIVLDTITVADGWNLIGSIGKNVIVSTITQIPAGNVTSQFFKFTNTYEISDTLKPGFGYWVKSNGGGKLVLQAQLSAIPKSSSLDLFDKLNRITITDNAGKKQTLYFGELNNAALLRYFEMPPSAPEEIFDVRFSSNRNVEQINSDLNLSESVIKISGAIYPIQIESEIRQAGNNYQLKTGDQKRLINGISKLIVNNPVGEISISSNKLNNIPSEFSLGETYPNPFNPSTKFQVGIPKNAEVNITVYDVLGREIKTLITGELQAGISIVEWNGMSNQNSMVPSGIYFIKMTAGNFTKLVKTVLMK